MERGARKTHLSGRLALLIYILGNRRVGRQKEKNDITLLWNSPVIVQVKSFFLKKKTLIKKKLNRQTDHTYHDNLWNKTNKHEKLQFLLPTKANYNLPTYLTYLPASTQPDQFHFPSCFSSALQTTSQKKKRAAFNSIKKTYKNLNFKVKTKKNKKVV